MRTAGSLLELYGAKEVTSAPTGHSASLPHSQRAKPPVAVPAGIRPGKIKTPEPAEPAATSPPTRVQGRGTDAHSIRWVTGHVNERSLRDGGLLGKTWYGFAFLETVG